MESISRFVSFGFVVGTGMWQIKGLEIVMGTWLCIIRGVLNSDQTLWLPTLRVDEPDHRPGTYHSAIQGGNQVLISIPRASQEDAMAPPCVKLMTKALWNDIRDGLGKLRQPLVAILAMVPLVPCSVVVP